MLCKKKTTASLQILFNQMPSHLEIMYVTIKTYIRCKHVFQNNHWDGIAEYASANSHLKTIKSLCHEIHHEDTPLDQFHSNFMMDTYYSWNPPIRMSLTAVGINDTDDYQINLVDNDHGVHDDEPIPSGTFGGSGHTCNGMEFCSLRGDHRSQRCNCTNQTFTYDGKLSWYYRFTDHDPSKVWKSTQENWSPQYLIPSNTSKSTQLMLDQFDNNFRLFSQRLKNDDTNLTIRVVLLKNNFMFLNYTFKILGTTNIIEAILASTYIMCSKLLEHISKGDTLLCSLEAGYLSIHNSIIRNKHVFNLVTILSQIKNKTGLYVIMEGSSYDWLEYASHDTIHIKLIVTPKKDVINPTIMTFLAGLWANKWENIKGHAQTCKFYAMTASVGHANSIILLNHLYIYSVNALN